MTFHKQWRSKQKDAIYPQKYTAIILMAGEKTPFTLSLHIQNQDCCLLSTYTEKHCPYQHMPNTMGRKTIPYDRIATHLNDRTDGHYVQGWYEI